MTDTPIESGDSRAPSRKRRFVLAAGLVVAVVVVAALSRRFGNERAGVLPGVQPGVLSGWNVLLVSIDTLRADRVGCYGYAAAATPTLDALAAAGVRCAQAIAPVPLTLPSHASLLTGLNPHRHGARINGLFRVDEKIVTLAELLKARGYRTGAVISSYVLDRRYGLARGFERYADDLTGSDLHMIAGYRERRAARANAEAIRWLRAGADERFFLWVHYFDPHATYAPPEPYRTRFADRPYDGEIAYTDEQLGRLLTALDELGLRDRTLIVVVSDHGESLGEHREQTHGMTIYDATMRVPVILQAKGVLPAGRVVHQQVGLIDIMPTVLDLLGEDVPPGLDGLSLLRSASAGRRELYIETLATKLQYGWAPLLGVRRNDVKFIAAPKPELYDLRADPKELNNLLSARRELASELWERLRALVGGDPALAANVTGNLPLDQASREKLAALGYVFKADGSATTQQALPDPKDMMDDLSALQRAETLADGGEHAKAIAILEPLVRAHPANQGAWAVIGLSYRGVGQWDRALAAFQREAEVGHDKTAAHVNLGGALLEMGKLSEAEAAFRRALAEDPHSHRAVAGLGAVLARQHRPDEAIKRFEQSIRMGRGSQTAGAHHNMGVIHHAAGRRREARKAFEAALAADPGHAPAARVLAELLQLDGQRQQAINLLTRTLQRRGDPKLLVALGKLQAEAGKLQPAVQILKRCLQLRPDSFAAHYQLAIVLQRLGRADQADAHLSECRRHLNPSDAQAQLLMGVLLAGRNELAEAEEHLRQALKVAPKSAPGHYNLGVLLSKRDKTAEAADAFRRAIAIDPQYAAAHTALGEMLSASSQPTEAANHYRRALKINPNLTAAREGLKRATTAPTTTTRSPPTSSRKAH